MTRQPDTKERAQIRHGYAILEAACKESLSWEYVPRLKTAYRGERKERESRAFAMASVVKHFIRGWDKPNMEARELTPLRINDGAREAVLLGIEFSGGNDGISAEEISYLRYVADIPERILRKRAEATLLEAP